MNRTEEIDERVKITLSNGWELILGEDFRSVAKKYCVSVISPNGNVTPIRSNHLAYTMCADSLVKVLMALGNLSPEASLDQVEEAFSGILLAIA